MQLKGVGGFGFDATEAKKKSPWEIELVILKNRNGRAGEKLTYKYYPLFNCFEEEMRGVCTKFMRLSGQKPYKT